MSGAAVLDTSGLRLTLADGGLEQMGLAELLIMLREEQSKLIVPVLALVTLLPQFDHAQTRRLNTWLRLDIVEVAPLTRASASSVAAVNRGGLPGGPRHGLPIDLAQAVALTHSRQAMLATAEPKLYTGHDLPLLNLSAPWGG